MGSQPTVTRIQPTECEIRAKALELAVMYVKTGGAELSRHPSPASSPRFDSAFEAWTMNWSAPSSEYVLKIAEQFYRFLIHTGPQDVISPR